MSRFCGEALLDAVDDRQLRGTLVGLSQQALGLVEEARVLERHAQAAGEGAQQSHVRFAEGVDVVEILEGDPAADLATDDERRDERGERRLALGNVQPFASFLIPFRDVVDEDRLTGVDHQLGERRAGDRRRLIGETHARSIE